MIAGNIESSTTNTPDDNYMNEGNEWLQSQGGYMTPKKPALEIKKPQYPVKMSTKQVRGAKNG